MQGRGAAGLLAGAAAGCCRCARCGRAAGRWKAACRCGSSLRCTPLCGRSRWRRGDGVLLLAIPIELMLSPVPVPTLLKCLDLCGCDMGKTTQRQDGGTDRHPGGRSTMMGLATWTPHQGRQDLPRASYRLEGGIKSITEQEHGVHGHRRTSRLPDHRDHLWEPDLLASPEAITILCRASASRAPPPCARCGRTA